MKLKETNIINCRTETGKVFGYTFKFNDDNTLQAVYFIGSRGDIFPEPLEEYQDVCADDEVTVGYMDKFFNTKVIDVWVD